MVAVYLDRDTPKRTLPLTLAPMHQPRNAVVRLLRGCPSEVALKTLVFLVHESSCWEQVWKGPISTYPGLEHTGIGGWGIPARTCYHPVYALLSCSGRCGQTCPECIATKLGNIVLQLMGTHACVVPKPALIPLPILLSHICGNWIR